MRGDSGYSQLFNTIDTSEEGSWKYWLVTNEPRSFSIPHLLHLHGHDLFVIGNGSGLYDEITA